MVSRALGFLLLTTIASLNPDLRTDAWIGYGPDAEDKNMNQAFGKRLETCGRGYDCSGFCDTYGLLTEDNEGLQDYKSIHAFKPQPTFVWSRTVVGN